MNDFASALSATLHEKAQERAMSADMQHAERQLLESIHYADRRRRVWIGVAAAAAVLVAAAGITLGVKLPATQEPTKQPTPSPTHTPTQPQLTAPTQLSALGLGWTFRLPTWTTHANLDPYGTGFRYRQSDGSRAVGLFAVRNMYPIKATTITHPSYGALVHDWATVGTSGYGTVSRVAHPIVGGRHATTMTVTVTRTAPGFAYCQQATDAATNSDNCAEIDAGRVMYVAIVNQGAGHPPTLLWESTSTDDPAGAEVAAEFAAWLPTAHFG
jgi:hypothetical protein